MKESNSRLYILTSWATIIGTLAAIITTLITVLTFLGFNPFIPTETPIYETFLQKISTIVLIFVIIVLIVIIFHQFNNPFITKKKPTLTDLHVSKKQTVDGIIFTIDNISFKMIHVEGGTFMMGATHEQEQYAEKNETPVHFVSLKDYWIGETPVTQELWEVVMGYNPSYFSNIRDYKNCKKRPVEQVTWFDCKEFIYKLNILFKKELMEVYGLKFYFPTEAQWEFAARGGNKKTIDTIYSGGNDLSIVGWHLSNTQETHPVGVIQKANELGVYDMSGNVWEWCQDAYDNYSQEHQHDPIIINESTRRVGRGGCWHSDANCCRVSYRNHANMLHAGNGLGLRLVLERDNRQ